MIFGFGSSDILGSVTGTFTIYVFCVIVALAPVLRLHVNLLLPFPLVKCKYLASLAFFIGFLLSFGSSGMAFSVARFSCIPSIILSSKLCTQVNTVVCCDGFVLSLITCYLSQQGLCSSMWFAWSLFFFLFTAVEKEKGQVYSFITSVVKSRFESAGNLSTDWLRSG